MKKYLMLLFLAIGIATATYAQNQSAEHTATEKTKELKEKLNLSSSQYNKIVDIYKESAQKFEKIRSEEHGDNSKMSIKLAPVRRETINKIKSILTPVQRAKFDKLLKQSSSSAEGWSNGWSAAS